MRRFMTEGGWWGGVKKTAGKKSIFAGAEVTVEWRGKDSSLLPKRSSVKKT